MRKQLNTLKQWLNVKKKLQKNLDYHDEDVVHTIRITLMRYDYTGHIAYNIGGNCKGASLLETSTLFECWSQDELERFTENDCELRYDEYYEIFTAVLLNDEGQTLGIEADESEIQDMVVCIEIVKIEEATEE